MCERGNVHDRGCLVAWQDFSDVQNQNNEEEELESGQGYRLTSELTVQNAMTENSGQYRCFVKIAKDQQIEGSPESVFVVGKAPRIHTHLLLMQARRYVGLELKNTFLLHLCLSHQRFENNRLF